MNAPVTTAVGRLFDAVAALTGVCMEASYEGQGPMLLESLCRSTDTVNRDATAFVIEKDSDGIWRADWSEMLDVLMDEGQTAQARAEYFHERMAQTLLSQVLAVQGEHAFGTVGLCGGVFQNRVLTERVLELLAENGYEVVLPECLPSNDASISAGQIVEASVRI
jgi:hydrogenase maturation protein HypF